MVLSQLIVSIAIGTKDMEIHFFLQYFDLCHKIFP